MNRFKSLSVTKALEELRRNLRIREGEEADPDVSTNEDATDADSSTPDKSFILSPQDAYTNDPLASVRLDTDAPDKNLDTMANVARIHAPARDRFPHKRRPPDEWQGPAEVGPCKTKRKKKSGRDKLFGWIGFVVAATGVVLSILFGSAEWRKRSSATGAVPLPDAHPPIMESRVVALSFLNAPTVEAKLSWVRDPRAVEPLMRDYYRDKETAAESPVELVSTSWANFAGLTFDQFDVITDTDTRYLAVCRTEEGSRVDWKSYARHNPVPWADFLQASASEPAPFRVTLSRGSYYNGVYADDKAVVCYQLQAPGLDFDLSGYVVLGSETHSQLEFLLREKEPQPAILTLVDARGTLGDRQLEIAGVVQAGWIEVSPESAPSGAQGP